MITSRPDPLKVPAELQQRVEAVSGLRALYRRGSFARTVGLACFAVLPAVGLLAMICLEGLTGRPPSAHVPSGYGNDPSSLALTLVAYLIIVGGFLTWMGFGLRNVLLNRGVRQFTFSFLIGGLVLVGMLGASGITSPDFSRSEAALGEGVPLQIDKLRALVEDPRFSGFSPQWQGYLEAQLALGRPSRPLNGIGQAIARGEDIGIAIPTAMRARFETKAGVPHSERSQRWLHAHRLQMAVLDVFGTVAAWSLLLLVVLGIGLTTLGYHVRGRARVINGLLQQLQQPPPQASAQP
ncbi:hypothetical protein [Stenotrophomonas maltophilia]|uniref:hypothetical protein n=1 Tax=Stenotrophomonas maltophilia TaxID=40324 RepID=UPI000D0DD967|nr:hypothetical protein [Stenotrophomonas maltophilia]PSM14807.1 hypothetical protein CV100_04880 [Stenotrophomonas maltophilia]